MRPSQATVAAVVIGAPAATVIAWAFNEFVGVQVPPRVEYAFGALIAGLIGYAFKGGKARDTGD